MYVINCYNVIYVCRVVCHVIRMLVVGVVTILMWMLDTGESIRSLILS